MNNIEIGIVDWMNGFAGTWGWFDDIAVIAAGDYLFPLLAAAALLGLWFSGSSPAIRERRQFAVLTGMTAVGVSNGFVAILNVFITRERPFNDFGDRINLLFYPSTDPSFPANPVVVSFAAAAAIWTVHRPLGYGVAAGGLLMGATRVYTGVFYPTDILGGALLGIATAALIGWVYRRLEPIPTLVIRLARAFALG